MFMPNQNDKKLTEDEIAELKKEINKIKASSIGNYRLRTTLVHNIDRLFTISGFDKLVRRWHMSYLPELTATGKITMINCPYCLKDVTLRSCRIDHVIPWKIYVRYQIYLKAIKKADEYLAEFDDVGDTISNQMTGKGQRYKLDDVLPEHIIKVKGLGDLIKRYFNDRNNMLLCCNKCNSAKSNKIIPLSRLRAAERKVSAPKNAAAAEKIKNIQNVLEAMLKTDVKYMKFIIDGVFAAGVSISKAPEIDYFESEGENKEAIRVTLRRMVKRVKGITSPDEQLRLHKHKLLDMPVFQQAAEINAKRRIKYDDDSVKDAENKSKFIDIYLEQANKMFEDYKRASLDYKGDQKANAGTKRDKTSAVSNAAIPVTQDNKTDTVLVDMFADKSKILEDSHIKYALMNYQALNTNKITFKGKLCFYCLGIYEPFCFELDHINSAIKKSTPNASTSNKISSFNQIDNIIPVCKICNTKKGVKILDKTLLASFLKQRQDEGKYHFGVEHAFENDKKRSYTVEAVDEIRQELLLP